MGINTVLKTGQKTRHSYRHLTTTQGFRTKGRHGYKRDMLKWNRRTGKNCRCQRPGK